MLFKKKLVILFYIFRPARRERGADTRLPDSDPRGGIGVVKECIRDVCTCTSVMVLNMHGINGARNIAIVIEENSSSKCEHLEESHGKGRRRIRGGIKCEGLLLE